MRRQMVAEVIRFAIVERVRSYAREETLPANVPLFTRGERQVDMFVVLDGEVDVSLPTANGESKIIAHHQRFDFSGELNLLTSQGSLVEARTVKERRLLRIPRNELQKLMRAEGDAQCRSILSRLIAPP